ncbi:flagellar hook-associated protein FlgL [Paenibacillus pabuli]|uniref:flagellar hook-associated protein FlgL n=1 Tax=Paenibacillus pabuli TaxID=1472 RepID=UPI0020496385|nr:flagellar hook-associated protein FlgL [Paenibacillus pabuli]
MLRVTSNMISSQLMHNLNRNTVRMSETQNQLATGRKLNKPSDDPVGITYSLRYRTELSANDQYTRNVNDTLSWLDHSDQMLDQTGNIIHRLKELNVQAASSTNPQSALDSIKTEVMQLKEQLIDIGNSKLNGKYVFNGQSYTQKPYDFVKDANGNSITTDVPATDNNNIIYSVGESVQLGINVTGSAIFGSTGDTSEDDQLFTTIDRLTEALTNGDFEAIGAQLDKFDSRLEKITTIRAEVGAKTNRVELMQSRLQDLGINLTDLQAKTEDADYAELIMNSSIQENIYNATLSAGAKIITPSLADFLR